MPDSVPKSLHVLSTLDHGGIETWLMNLVRTTSRSELSIDVCLTHDRGERGVYADEFEGLGGKIWHCYGRRNLLRFTHQFRRVLHEGCYQIVHSHPHHFSGIVLKVAAKAGVPVRIAHCHSDSRSMDKVASPIRRLYLRYTERLIQRYATAGFACSDVAACSLFGEGWQKDSRWRIMPCGIDPNLFLYSINRDSLRSEFGIEPHHRVIGHVGRFIPAKNHSFVLDVAAEAVRREPNIRFLLVGDGPLRAEIERTVKSRALDEFVIFAGGRNDVPRLMCGVMDVFLFPSRSEGLGVALVEAQAAGLPCIASTNVPCTAEMVAGSCEFLSLELSPSHWAIRCLEAKGRIDSITAIKEIEKNGGTLRSNIELLKSIST